MGYVRTTEELDRYKKYFRSYEEHFQRLAITFTTTADFARAVLPPCFDVPDVPTGGISIATERIAYDGYFTLEESEYATVKLRAVHKGVEGNYVLAAIVSGDMMITLGREIWGMPKKRGKSRVYDNGRQMYGYCQRRGVRLLEIEADLVDDHGPQPEEEYRFFEIKAWPTAAGDALQGAPQLVAFDGTVTQHALREGDPDDVRIKIVGTPADPVDTIPIERIDRVFGEYGVSVTTLSYVEDLTDADYEPYVFGRNWDDLTHPALRQFGAEQAVSA